MKVFLAIPQGIAYCGGKRVHGYAEKYEPTIISWKDYTGNRGAFVEAPYTPEYLSKVFGKEFPVNVRFTLGELKTMEFRLLQKIAVWLNCDGSGRKDNFVLLIRSKLKDL